LRSHPSPTRRRSVFDNGHRVRGASCSQDGHCCDAAQKHAGTGFAVELSALLEKLKLSATQPRIDLLQGLFVGLSIIDLATGRKNGRARAKAALNLAFDLLSGDKA
jgi:hypothetical protein